ncbi:MAG: EAL domain-containing protein [Gammaproteobacteria bacterium]|nr:EAL domain-containing protein [Gammaproteobacteria bacterium]
MQKRSSAALTKFGQLVERISDLDTTAEIYACIADFVPTVLPAEHVTITHFSPEQRGIVVQAVYANPSSQLDICVGQVFSTRKTYDSFTDSVAVPIIYNPAENLERDINKLLHEADFISVLVVPIVTGREIIGTVNIASQSHEYTRQDRFTLEQTAAILAIAVSYVDVFQSRKESARHRLYAEHLEYLNELSEELLRAPSTQAALNLAADCATKLVGAKRVSFCALDDDPNFVTIEALVGLSTDRIGTRLTLEASGLEQSLVERTYFHATDLLHSPIKAHRSLGEAGNNHVWSYPIFSQDKTKRCFNITAPDTDLHIEDAISALDTLARLLNSTLERITAQQEMTRQAKSDPLTGLCNRKAFHERLDLAIRNSVSENCTCILYLDLDLFKNVNDTMGHIVGDQVLKDVANRISDYLTSNDTLARIGGDEFMILLTQLKNRPSVESIAEDLIRIIGTPIPLDSQEITIGASIGICHYPNHGSTSAELIKNADIAMYKAKDSGRNQFYVFTEALAHELSYRLLLQKDLVAAIEEGQFSLVYQPQIDIHSLKADCLEVLLRWEHPTLGWIRPDIFIPIAEHCGLIGQITDWVLKKAFEEIKTLEQTHPQMRLAINVSAVEFSPQHNLLDRLQLAVNQAGIDPHRLEIELTETAFLKHADHAEKLARQLAEFGISIAIDDFGTGYASLSYLVQLPINCIKVDKSFVDDVEHDLKKQAIIKGIIAISQGLDLICLAEGAETVEQLNWLKAAGCDSAQGYLFSKPVSLGELPDVLTTLIPTEAQAA